MRKVIQERSSETDMEGHTFKIEGFFYKDKCFPGLNDMLHEASRNPRAYAKMKKEYQMIACNAARRGLKRYKAKGKVRLHYKFAEPSKGQLRDYSNIESAAIKIIEDALIACGVIKDDGPAFVDPSEREFIYVSGTPYIEVTVTEIQ